MPSKRRVAPLLRDEIAHLPGLVIRNDHLLRIGRANEAAFQFENRQ